MRDHSTNESTDLDKSKSVDQLPIAAIRSDCRLPIFPMQHAPQRYKSTYAFSTRSKHQAAKELQTGATSQSKCHNVGLLRVALVRRARAGQSLGTKRWKAADLRIMFVRKAFRSTGRAA